MPHDIQQFYFKDSEGNRTTIDLKFVRFLGRGTYGDVYQYKGPDDTLYAVKYISKSKLSTEKRVLRTRNEIRLMYKLASENVAKLYYDLETGTDFILAMEYCNGGDLLDLIIKRGKLSEKEA